MRPLPRFGYGDREQSSILERGQAEAIRKILGIEASSIRLTDDDMKKLPGGIPTETIMIALSPGNLPVTEE